MSGPPLFDVALPTDGYAWWYLDVLDPEGGRGFTLIALLGSVFSPGYARARARGPTDPLEFCAINIAVYGARKRWVMTEHSDVERSADHLRIGGTTLRYDGAELVVEFDEQCSPFGRALKGSVRVTPVVAGNACHQLDAAGRHRWWPIAPVARAVVELGDERFEGPAYHDINSGDRPLEADFRRWDWCRSADGTVLYDVVQRDGPPIEFGVQFTPDGPQPIAWSTRTELKKGGWGVARATRSESPIQLHATLEDTPFYTRSWLHRDGPDGPVHVMHESLDLDRFDRAWVRCLLPFKMRGGWRW
ncbi:MAG: carotenoid 1,2-hydratase [Bradymonadia bacterium]|jgi:carotenoid 1,2-hydratase